MGRHHCHLPGCTTSCAPRLLMCPAHWFMLPGHLMADVYATVRTRGPNVDASWAPWWRAQGVAIVYVLRKLGETPEKLRGMAHPPGVDDTPESWAAYVDKIEARELGFAATLEAKNAST